MNYVSQIPHTFRAAFQVLPDGLFLFSLEDAGSLLEVRYSQHLTGGEHMKPDRFTKAVLTIIAACLVWICLNGIPSASARAQSDRFAISAAGHTFLRAYRLNVNTGEVDICSLEKGCKPIPGSRVQ